MLSIQFFNAIIKTKVCEKVLKNCIRCEQNGTMVSHFCIKGNEIRIVYIYMRFEETIVSYVRVVLIE